MNSNKRNVGESRIRDFLGEVKNEFSGGIDSNNQVGVRVRANYEVDLVETKIKKVEEEVKRSKKK